MDKRAHNLNTSIQAQQSRLQVFGASGSFLIEQGQVPVAPKVEIPAPVKEERKGVDPKEIQQLILKYTEKIIYSDKYNDEIYEYRHVSLPRKEVYMILKTYPAEIPFAPLLQKAMSGAAFLDENEWRAIHVQQSQGWVHYTHHRPEPRIFSLRLQR